MMRKITLVTIELKLEEERFDEAGEVNINKEDSDNNKQPNWKAHVKRAFSICGYAWYIPWLAM